MIGTTLGDNPFRCSSAVARGVRVMSSVGPAAMNLCFGALFAESSRWFGASDVGHPVCPQWQRGVSQVAGNITSQRAESDGRPLCVNADPRANFFLASTRRAALVLTRALASARRVLGLRTDG